MYLLFMIIGGLTAGLLGGFEVGTFFLGAFGGLISAIVIKYLTKWWKSTNFSSSNSSSSSAFDGCILLLLLEGLFSGLGDI